MEFSFTVHITGRDVPEAELPAVITRFWDEAMIPGSILVAVENSLGRAGLDDWSVTVTDDADGEEWT